MSSEYIGFIRPGDLGPWARRGLAVLAGALSVLALAPFFVWPILFVTLPVLVWLIDAEVAAAPRKAALGGAIAGWFFGFGYFLAGLFWIGVAFLVEAEKFAVLMPFAVLLMPAGLAFFWAGAAAVATWHWAPGWPRVLSLAVALSVAEWLRGHVLTGFPWNVIGYALTSPDVMMQSASVVGIYGLTFVALLVFVAPLVLWADARAGRVEASQPKLALIAAVGCLTVMAAWGALRLASKPNGPAEPIRIRIVQASIPQREKWQPAFQRRNFERHLALSGQNALGVRDGAKGVRLIVWPEAAMPFRPLEMPAVLEMLGRIVPEGGFLAAGVLRIDEASRPGHRRALNSIAVIDSKGSLAAVYDKIHLVPFGEYLPFQTTLEAIGLEQLTRIRGGFDVGPVPRPLIEVPGLPRLDPLICYEAIFPGVVVQGEKRPAALLNVTNDGWFGNTSGPYQHFHQARVRAVEEGLPLLRSANNGISAIVDSRGQIIAQLPLNAVGILDADLPGTSEQPIYAKIGDILFWLSVLAGAVLVAALRVRQ